MPGLLVQLGATVTCLHGGKATPTAPNTRVMLGGAPSLTVPAAVTVAGCPFPPPNAGNGPCVTGQWTSGTTRVLSNGLPLVFQTSSSTCAPTGTPLLVVATQTRVIAQ